VIAMWTRHGKTIWHKTRDCDRRVAECDTEEDARLVASAPELLAELEALTEALPENSMLYRGATAVIAKAKGERT